MEKDSKNKTDKKEEDKDKKPENIPKKSSSNILQVILTIVKYTLVSSVVFAVIGTVVYLTLANMAFFGLLPSKISEKMPIVNNIVKEIAAKERRIKLAKEMKDDQKKIQKAGELQIDLLDGQEVEGKGFVPFLYKLRVVKNKINNKELAEIWVDNVLVVKVYTGIGENSPFKSKLT